MIERRGLILVMLLLLSASGLAGPNSQVPAVRGVDLDNVKPADRAAALVHLLQLTATNPTEMYLDMLTRLAPAADTIELMNISAGISKTMPTTVSASGKADLILPIKTTRLSSEGDTISIELAVGEMTPRASANDTLHLRMACRNGRVSVTGLPQALTRLIQQVGNTAKSQPKLSTSVLSPTTYNSPNLLRPDKFFDSPLTFEEICVLDAFVSRQHFEGQEIFNGPSGLCAFTYEDSTNWNRSHDLLFVTDRNWDRIIYSGMPLNTDPDPWIKPYGSHGNDTATLNCPTAVDFVGFKIFVADGYNNRVQAYNVNAFGDMGYSFTIQRDFDFIPDIACAWIPRRLAGGAFAGEVAVLDQGNRKICIYNDSGVYTRTINALEFGSYTLQRPTAITYGRHMVDNLATSWLYVCDAATRRVVAKSTDPNKPGIYYTLDNAFPADAYLTSIDCDWYGYIYVLDQHNGQIRMFDPTLKEQIAVFGSLGKGPGQLWYPRGLAHQFGWAKTSDTGIAPLNRGGVVVSEIWGEQTGVRKYVQGFDICNFQVRYDSAKDVAGAVDQIVVSWWQSGPSYNSVTLHEQNNLEQIATIENSVLHLPGYNYLVYRFPRPPNSDGTGHISYRVLMSSRGFYTSDSTESFDDVSVNRGFIPCGSNTSELIIGGVQVIDAETQMDILVNTIYSVPYGWYVLKANVSDGCVNANNTVVYQWSQGDSGTTYFTQDPRWIDIDSCCFTSDTNWVYVKFRPKNQVSAMANASIAKVKFQYRNEYGSLVCFACGSAVAEKPSAGNLETFCCSDTVIVNYECVPPGSGQTCPWSTPPTQCPFLYAWDGTDYRLVNNLLAHSEDPVYAAQTSADFLVLPNLIAVPGDDIRLEIREEAEEITAVDALRAFALLVPSSLGRVGFTDRGRFITLQDEIRPVQAVTSDGQDVLAHISDRDGDRFAASGPGWLDIEYQFGSSGTVKGASTVAQSLAPPGSIGGIDPDKEASKLAVVNEQVANIISVKYLAEDSTWQDVTRLAPRVAPTDTRVEFTGALPDPLRLRIEWTTGISLDYLPYVIGQPVDVTPTPLTLLAASHSDMGDARSAVSAVDGSKVTINPGEKLTLRFGKPVIESGQQALFVLKADGEYRRAGDTTSYPISFGFDQNYPNPFNPSTSLRFALPLAAHVKLEIYNILGQKVATVVDEEYAAGRHTVTWNGASDDGRQVGSGVYFARLTAGDRTATRKLMVVK